MKIKIFMVICVILFLFSHMGCEGITEISGRITDSQNSPINGAKVVIEELDTVYPVRSESLSGKKGNYSILLTHAPGADVELDYKVTKNGYKTYNQKIKGGTINESLNITLESQEESVK